MKYRLGLKEDLNGLSLLAFSPPPPPTHPSPFLVYYSPYWLLLLLSFPLFHSHLYTSLLLYYSNFFLMNLTLPHSSLSALFNLMPCFLWMLYFYSHPVSIHPNDPVSPQAELLLLDGTSAQWRRTLLFLHYPFMEYRLLWWAIFLQSSNDSSLGDPVHLHCNLRRSH